MQDLYNEIQKTENLLRDFVNKVMILKIWEDWIKKYFEEEQYNNLLKLKNKSKSIKYNNLLYYSCLLDLKNIISKNYNKYFKEIFSKKINDQELHLFLDILSKKEFNIFYDFLNKNRNSMSHWRIILEEDKLILIWICLKFRNLIYSYMASDDCIDAYLPKIEKIIDSYGDTYNEKWYTSDNFLIAWDKIKFEIDAIDPKWRELEYCLLEQSFYPKIWQKSNVIEYIIPKCPSRHATMSFEIRYKWYENEEGNHWYNDCFDIYYKWIKPHLI